MDLCKARNLALDLMQHHGLLREPVWRFQFDRARRRFGYCDYRRRIISLSEPLTAPEPDEDRVRNTILHEIAHALVGPGKGHGPVWRRQAMTIGCNGRRCGDSEVKLACSYVGQCPVCGITVERHRRNFRLFHPACRRAGQPLPMLKWRRA